jgi:hypothetical protein
MKGPSRRSFRSPIEQATGLVVVMMTVAAAVSSTLAAELPGAAGNNQSLPSIATSVCEPQPAQASVERPSARPPLPGLQLQRSDRGRFDLWRPAGWHEVHLGDSLASTLWLVPDDPSREASLYIEATDTSGVQTPEESAARAEWFDHFLHALPHAYVEWQARWIDGNAVGFEARYSYFIDGEELISRWVRVQYIGTARYTVVAEAETAALDRLQPDFLTMMVTFRPDDFAEPATLDMCVA